MGACRLCGRNSTGYGHTAKFALGMTEDRKLLFILSEPCAALTRKALGAGASSLQLDYGPSSYVSLIIRCGRPRG